MSGFGGGPAFSFGQPAGTSTPSAFGAQAVPAASAFGAPAAFGFGGAASGGFGAATGGFGAPTASAFGAPTAGGFGAPAASGFGAPATGGFGASTATGFGAPAANTFGAASTPAFGTQPATGFGAPTTSGFGAGLTGGLTATGFGAPAATGFGSAAPSAFGSFGAPSSSTGFGASSFGNPTATTAFGAPASTAFGAPASTGFGAPATSAFGAFGATPAATGFGASATSGFGTAFGGGFGPSTATSGFGGLPATTGFGSFAPALAATPAPSQYPGGDRVLEIQQFYAPIIDSQTGLPVAAATAGRTNVPNDSMCKFDTVMYNPKSAGRSGRTSVNTGPRWEQAERDNPDPQALEATRELGISSLRKRFENQNSECTKYRAHADELRGIMEAVEKSTRQTGLRVEALQSKQKQLYNKMLSVVRSVEVLRCQGVPIDSSERRYRERMERLLVALQIPQAQLQDIFAMGSQQDRPQDVYSDLISSADMDAMRKVLITQRDGLQHLTDILIKDSRDIEIMKQRLKSTAPAPQAR